MLDGVSATGGPSATPDPSSGSESGAGMSIQQVLDTKVSTLGQLKQLLINALGQQDGMKFYNQFLQMIGVTMLAPLQQASQNAQNAAQNMEGDQT